jgi:plasmid stabilization system protein ParE
MKYRVTYLDEARQDMKDIAVYLSQFYPGTARNFASKLKKQVRGLKDMPYTYQAYEDDPYFRRMVVDDYLLFYSVDEERHLVDIHRIFHASRDVSRQLLTNRPEVKAIIQE